MEKAGKKVRVGEIVDPAPFSEEARRLAALDPDARDWGREDIDPLLEHLSRWMDAVFRIPGLNLRFGLDAILGLIPGLGDTLTSLVSLYILAAAARYRVPRITMVRMALNVAVDYLVGSVPVFGDLFDVWWKANLKNMELLKRSAGVSPREAGHARWSDWLMVGVIIACLLVILAGSIALALWLVAWLVESLASIRPAT